MHPDALVLGLDVGGTSSRAVVADLRGRTLGIGEAGGGNPNSHPPEQAVGQVRAAAHDALAGIATSQVRAGVLGMAGVSKMSDPVVAELFDTMWAELGLTCPMTVVSDCEVAFAAGTPAESGTVVIAGTGAVAARISQHRLASTVGGYGWLLGDEGSAFWLGREAVRESLRALDRRESEPGELVSSVFSTLLAEPGAPGDELRKHLITAVNAAPPIQLAELAPLVTTASRAGDKTAIDIVRRAAALLAETALATRNPGDTTPIVLAGSLAAAGNPIGDALRAELTARSIAEIRTAGPGASGAAWLAALDVVSAPADDLHAKYLG